MQVLENCSRTFWHKRFDNYTEKKSYVEWFYYGEINRSWTESLRANIELRHHWFFFSGRWRMTCEKFKMLRKLCGQSNSFLSSLFLGRRHCFIYGLLQHWRIFHFFHFVGTSVQFYFQIFSFHFFFFNFWILLYFPF